MLCCMNVFKLAHLIILCYYIMMREEAILFIMTIVLQTIKFQKNKIKYYNLQVRVFINSWLA